MSATESTSFYRLMRAVSRKNGSLLLRQRCNLCIATALSIILLFGVGILHAKTKDISEFGVLPNASDPGAVMGRFSFSGDIGGQWYAQESRLPQTMVDATFPSGTQWTRDGDWDTNQCDANSCMSEADGGGTYYYNSQPPTAAQNEEFLKWHAWTSQLNVTGTRYDLSSNMTGKFPASGDMLQPGVLSEGPLAKAKAFFQGVDGVLWMCGFCYQCSFCDDRMPFAHVAQEKPDTFRVVVPSHVAANANSVFGSCAGEGLALGYVNYLLRLPAMRNEAAVPGPAVMVECARFYGDLAFLPIVEGMITVMFLVLLMPLFVSRVSSEKNARIISLLKLIGLSSTTYVATNAAVDYIIYLCAFFVLCAFSLGFGVYTFSLMTLPVLLLMLLNGASTIAAAYLIALSSKTVAMATSVAYLASLILPGGAFLLNVFVFVGEPAWILKMVPIFSFSRGIALFSRSLMAPSIYPPNNAEVWALLGWHILGTLLLLSCAVVATVGFSNIKMRARALTRPQEKSAPIGMVSSGGREEPLQREPSHVLSCKAVSKRYGDFAAVDNVSFDINHSECFGLLGVNGAGKTTLIRILSGEIQASAGFATVNGHDMAKGGSQRFVGVCPQFDVLFKELTAVEHVLFFARLKNVPIREEIEYADELVNRVGLQSSRSRFGGDLSGGQKRRLSLAIALTGDPDIVFLDEPSSSLDVSGTRELWKTITEVKQRRAILLTTHNMVEADVLCDRIAILDDGKLIAVDTPSALKRKHSQHLTLRTQFVTVDSMAPGRAFVMSCLPKGSEVIKQSAQSRVILFSIPKEGDHVSLSAVFSRLERRANGNGIQAWSIVDASMNDVFLSIVA